MKEKKWTANDARAEMAREVKRCKDAIDTLREVGLKLRELGEATGARMEQNRALNELSGQAYRAVYGVENDEHIRRA